MCRNNAARAGRSTQGSRSRRSLQDQVSLDGHHLHHSGTSTQRGTHTAGKHNIAGPLGIAVQCLLEAYAASARCRRRATGPDVLDVVAELEEARVPAPEVVALPLPRSVLESSREVVVVDNLAESELVLQRLLRLGTAESQHAVDVVDNLLHVGAAVLGHALLHGVEVLPEVVDGLDDGAGGMVSPERARGLGLGPGGERAAVRPAREDPGRTGGVTGAVAAKGQHHVAREVGRVEDRVLQRQVLQVFGAEGVVGRAGAPVAVLHHHHGALDCLREQPRDGAVGQVARVAVGSNLAGGEEDDGRSRAGVELGAVPEPLREGAQPRVGVVDELLEDARADRSLADVVAVVVERGRHQLVQAAKHGGRGLAGEQQARGSGEKLHGSGSGWEEALPRAKKQLEPRSLPRDACRRIATYSSERAIDSSHLDDTSSSAAPQHRLRHISDLPR